LGGEEWGVEDGVGGDGRLTVCGRCWTLGNRDADGKMRCN
jgi:hypothetical protein